MAQQITNTEVLAYIAETVWGTTPATPTGQIVRQTGVQSTHDKTTVMSNETTNSRETADIIQTAGKGGLTVPFEMSYDTQFEDWLQALTGGSWTSNVLKIGTTRRGLTFQRSFPDITQFMHITGAVPTSMQFGTGIGNIISGSASFMSKFPTIDAVTAWSGLTAAGTNPVFDPIAAIQLLQEGGAGSIAGATEFSVQLENGIISLDQLSSLSPLDIQLGAFKASGTFSAYFADLTYWTKFAAHTTTSLSIAVGGASTKKYTFYFPKVKLSKVDMNNGGMNNAIIQKYSWETYKDATDTTMRVTRAP
jgi:Phage tail tube protein